MNFASDRNRTPERVDQRARPQVENLTISVTGSAEHVTARVSVWTRRRALPSKISRFPLQLAATRNSSTTRIRTRERVDQASASSRRKSYDFRYGSAATRNRTRERVDWPKTNDHADYNSRGNFSH
jgi:hypothetical protein